MGLSTSSRNSQCRMERYKKRLPIRHKKIIKAIHPLEGFELSIAPSGAFLFPRLHALKPGLASRAGMVTLLDVWCYPFGHNPSTSMPTIRAFRKTIKTVKRSPIHPAPYVEPPMIAQAVHLTICCSLLLSQRPLTDRPYDSACKNI